VPIWGCRGDRGQHRRDRDATLKGEVTVERGDVMRGVGRALADLGKAGAVDSTAGRAGAHRVAESLVATPPRVDAVIVARHTGAARYRLARSRRVEP
jgi:hypothetical protein